MTKQPLIIGVVCNGYNKEDIDFYSNEFRLIDKLFEKHVKVVFIGTDDLPPGSTYTKPVSINHWFRHLFALKIDLLFIPLQQTEYNQSSENTNKAFEISTFGIPVITLDQYPYNRIIKDKRNGFLYESKETFIDYLKVLLVDHLTQIKMCGLNAYESSAQRLSYTEENLIELIKAFD